jgi:hypothetical protein
VFKTKSGKGEYFNLRRRFVSRVMKSKGMGWVNRREERNLYKISAGKPEGKRPKCR